MGEVRRAWLVAPRDMQGRPAVLEVISEGVGGGAKHVYDLVNRLQDEYAFVVACPNNGPYFDHFRAIGVRVIDLSSTAASPQSVLRLLWVIKRYGIELVHAHGRKAGFHGRLASLLARTPVVYSFHGLHHQKHGVLLRTLYVGIEKALMRHTARVINVSRSERQECLALGLSDAHKSLVIANGIDWQGFEAIVVDAEKLRADLGFAPEDLIVGHVAKFDVQKAQDDLAAAIPYVLRQCPEAKFLFVGEGALRPQIERQVVRLGVASRVVFTGFRQDVAALLQMMDVFALPSRWEGLSLVLLEAMACRKPVVATRVTGNVDVVVDGVTGFLVPVGAPQALAEKIVALLHDAKLRAEYGQKGRERVEHDFSLDAMVVRTRAVYQELLAGP
jgi:glycosyltransferase involved in cell wall biosynthesis